MVMYGIYNSDTLETLIDSVHRLHNQITWNEKLFAGKIDDWYCWCLSEKVGHYAINSLLFLTTAREKYVKMHERFINQIKMYAKVIRILSKDYLPISLLLPSNLNKIVVHIDWKEVLMTLNGNMICLPTSVIIPMRDKIRLTCIIRKRPLLLHIMLKQGTSWYALDSKESLLPPTCLDDSEI